MKNQNIKIGPRYMAFPYSRCTNVTDYFLYKTLVWKNGYFAYKLIPETFSIHHILEANKISYGSFLTFFQEVFPLRGNV